MADKGEENRVPNTAGDVCVDPVQSELPLRLSSTPVAPEPIKPDQRKSRQCRALNCFKPEFMVLTGMAFSIWQNLDVYQSCTVSDSNKPDDVECYLTFLVYFSFFISGAMFLVLPKRFLLILQLCLDLILIVIYLCVNYLLGTRDDVKLERLIVAGVNGVLILAPGVYLSYRYIPLGTGLCKTGGLRRLREVHRDSLFVLLYELQLWISMILLTVALRPQYEAQDIVLRGLVLALILFLPFHWSLKTRSFWLTILTLVTIWTPSTYICFKLFETKDGAAAHLPDLAFGIFLYGLLAQASRYLFVVLLVSEHKDEEHRASLAQATPVIHV